MKLRSWLRAWDCTWRMWRSRRGCWWSFQLLSIFFLKDGRAFSEILLDLVQSRLQRELLQGVLSDLNQMLAHFIRAQLTLAALTFVMYSAVLAMMQVQNALVLGTVGGMLEFIPVLGPLVAAVIIIGAALLTGYKHWLVLVIFLVVGG